jgi:L-aminopeptidase/D-esterase-like protein
MTPKIRANDGANCFDVISSMSLVYKGGSMKKFCFGLAILVLGIWLVLPPPASAQSKPRARHLGIPFQGTPGPLNAITDVKGVEVGHATIISGEGKLKVGIGPVRTGVTAILPRGKKPSNAVLAGWFSLNGNGEMTGTTWVEESGFLEGPVMITNTHSVGVVRDGVIAWRVKQGPPDQTGYWWSLPVVAETYDGELNDVNGFHVTQKHVFEALESAKSGPVVEGNVGGGTGSVSGNGSGDIFIAFSTANPQAADTSGLAGLTMLPNDRMNPLFEATVQATEEAIINALVAAETMTGVDNHKVDAIPHDLLRKVMRDYNRLQEAKK